MAKVRWLLLAGSFLFGCGGASRDGGASGGDGGGSSGGVDSSGGTASGGNATSAGGSTPFNPSRADCQPSQWRCPPPTACTGDGKGFVVPGACACDPSLPVDVHCKPGERLACLHATMDSTYQLIRDVQYGCRCVTAEWTCKDCANLFGAMEAGCIRPDIPDGPLICGCAEVFTR